MILGKHADELRQMWQGRALAQAKDNTFDAVLAIIAHEWPTALPILMKAVFPGFRDIDRPFICGYGFITKTGRVVAPVLTDTGCRLQIIYDTEAGMVRDFRLLADRIKLSDRERVEMTTVLKRWVSADYRVNFMGEKKLSA